MLEKQFQRNLINKLQKRFPGCLILKNDPTYKQGIPDLLILFKNKWAMLECKKSLASTLRPNQKYYIDILSKMSFAKIISPENEEAILDELQQTFGT